jgi:DNA-binding HxlR family transcriptional regulator
MAQLARLVSRRHVVEVLDALAESPRTRADLRRQLPGRARALDTALRALAAHGAVRRTDLGTWDLPGAATTRYQLTPAGHRLVALLSRLDVWTALYSQQPPD